MHIPQHRGSGVIKMVFLEEGLYLRYSRLTYYEDIEIIRPAKLPDGDIIFSLSFLLTPASLKPGKRFPAPSAINGYSNTIFLTSNNTRLSTRIPKGSLSHTIELLFSREWLCTHLSGMEEKTDAVSGCLGTDNFLTRKEGLPDITEMTRPGDVHLLREMESELNQPLFNLLSIRSRALMLLANIINEGVTPKLPLRETYYTQTIRQVEQRLVRSLENMLPSQKQLAKEFALSESTLKRHFRAIYGKTMYEYYLEKKMDLAKWLLKEKKISVSETAYMLGYEKVSSFITMFKKYHKVLPGSLR